MIEKRRYLPSNIFEGVEEHDSRLDALERRVKKLEEAKPSSLEDRICGARGRLYALEQLRKLELSNEEHYWGVDSYRCPLEP